VSRPELKERPVAVSHGNAATTHGYSEISSCNYPARKYNVKNGMFLSEALKLCPDLVLLPYDFDLYRTLSEQARSLVYKMCTHAFILNCLHLIILHVHLHPLMLQLLYRYIEFSSNPERRCSRSR
jgi:DNA repair protein REV1